jgi:hypothetical protein
MQRRKTEIDIVSYYDFQFSFVLKNNDKEGNWDSENGMSNITMIFTFKKALLDGLMQYNSVKTHTSRDHQHFLS